MLTPEPMVKLRIICMQDDLRRVINEFYAAKAIDVISHQTDGPIDIGKPYEDSEAVSEAIVKARSLMYRLDIEPLQTQPKNSIHPINEQVDRVNHIHENLTGFFDAQKRLSDAEKRIRGELDKVKALKKLGIGLDLFKNTSHIVHYVGHVTNAKGLKERVRSALKKDYEIHSTHDGDKDLIAVFASRDHDEKLLELLKDHQFQELKIPQGVDDSSEKKLKEDLDSTRKELNRVRQKLHEATRKHQKELREMEHHLDNYYRKATTPLMFGGTENLAVITGWVPKNRKARFMRRIQHVTDNNVHIEDLSFNEKEDVPVKIENPSFMQPYEYLLQLFSMPSYKEIDPTIFMFITFPLFFGFMLGDIGYGLVTGGLFLFLMKKMPDMKPLLKIMLYSSISTIIFGFVFGEFFGFEMAHWHFVEEIAHSMHIHYPFIHRGASTVMQLITISGVAGFIHVNLGLIFGFVNVTRMHDFKHALVEKGGWVLLEVAAALLAVSGFGLAQVPLWWGFVVLALALYVLFKGEGLQGLIEFPTLFIHMGSYLRLMAIGLASVSLAHVINEQSAPLISSNPLMLIGGILIFAIGHTINIALGIIGPFLHSLRLHYVEHFTKFYHGGGRTFAPLGAHQRNGG